MLKWYVRAMKGTQLNLRMPTPAGRVFSEQLCRIRVVHIKVWPILQSLVALQDGQPCASCTSVCCKEVMCWESLDSDFLRFL